LREHFAEPVRAQAHAVIDEGEEDDTREIPRRRRTHEPL
jgi:hypothetical protein